MRSLAVKLTLFTSKLLPLPVAHTLGAWLGWMIFIIPNRHRHVASANIRLCFPALKHSEQQKLLRQSLMELGKSILEVGTLWYRNKEQVSNLVKETSGEALVTKALEEGRGVILALPHLGAWELVGLYCSAKYPMTSLYRPPKITKLDGLMRHARERFGSTLVPTDASGVRALFSALRNNGLVAILPDQDPGNTGNVMAPFFGIQANTMTLLPRLAQKTGATVIFCHARRLPGGAGFHLYFGEASPDIQTRDATVAAKAMNKDVEQCVANCPTQYQWNYKRFKHRPPGEANPYNS